jgi:hypothetical protein
MLECLRSALKKANSRSKLSIDGDPLRRAILRRSLRYKSGVTEAYADDVSFSRSSPLDNTAERSRIVRSIQMHIIEIRSVLDWHAIGSFNFAWRVCSIALRRSWRSDRTCAGLTGIVRGLERRI